MQSNFRWTEYSRAAGYVDWILKGAEPAELSVQDPTKFELIVNLRIAKREATRATTRAKLSAGLTMLITTERFRSPRTGRLYHHWIYARFSKDFCSKLVRRCWSS